MSSPNAVTVLVCAAFLIVALRTEAAEPSENAVASALARKDYTAAADLLRSQLREVPDDEAARFMLARVLAWSGDYAASVSEFDALTALHPANVDYSFGRAQALAWAGKDEAALSELARARSLAPDYEDVWQLELSVLARGKDTATRLREFRTQAARRFPDSTWWKGGDERKSTLARTQLSFGGTRETLSTDAPDWTSFFVQVSRRRNESSTVYGVINREERFGRRDLSVGGGGDWRLSRRWLLGLDLGVGSNTDFLPRLTAAVWAQQTLANGWGTRLLLRQRRYADTHVTSGAFTLDRYFGNFRAAYTLDISRLQGDASAATHSARLDYYASDRTELDVTIAGGQEIEATGPGLVLRTHVRGLSIGVRHRLSGRWRLSGWLGSHRQGDFYTRRYVGLSLTTEL